MGWHISTFKGNLQRDRIGVTGVRSFVPICRILGAIGSNYEPVFSTLHPRVCSTVGQSDMGKT